MGALQLTGEELQPDAGSLEPLSQRDQFDATAEPGTGWSLRGPPAQCLARCRTSAAHSRGRENGGGRHGREDPSDRDARSPESEERIAQAAAARQQSVSTFVLAAAVRGADMVLARADVTLMPAEQFDTLMDSLEIPDQAPRLLEAATRPRRFKRA